MKLRQKVIFLAITPLILALCAIAFAVRHQAITLAEQQRATIQQAYLASKEAELKHYVTLASHSIASLYQSGRKDEATQEEAKRILSALSYGDDGYFFIYDLQGKSLMHPRQPELVGQNLWQLRDAEGNLTIQRLMQRAKSGGGFERYNWIKPSTNKSAPKLGYVILMPEWGWMMGTGIYMDDVDQALAKVDAQQSRNIRSTMELIAAIAILGSLLVAACGLVLNLRELRVADAKLKVLAQRVVESQEEERARLSRDLHDGISQWLVSIKLQIEAGIARLAGNTEQKKRRPPPSSGPPSNSTRCWAKCGAFRTTCARPSSTTWAWPPRSTTSCMNLTTAAVRKPVSRPARRRRARACPTWSIPSCSASPRKR